MRKEYLENVVSLAKDETKNALQVVFDSLNQGQQKKILKNEEVKQIFDLYGVEYGAENS